MPCVYSEVKRLTVTKLVAPVAIPWHDTVCLTLTDPDYFRNSHCGAWPKHSDWKSSQIWTFGSLRVNEASSTKTPRPNRAPCFTRSAQESRWADPGCCPIYFRMLKLSVVKLTLKDYFQNSACGAWPKHSEVPNVDVWVMRSATPLIVR